MIGYKIDQLMNFCCKCLNLSLSFTFEKDVPIPKELDLDINSETLKFGYSLSGIKRNIQNFEKISKISNNFFKYECLNCETFFCLTDLRGFYLNPFLNLSQDLKKKNNYSNFFEILIDTIPLNHTNEIDIPIQLKTQKYLLQEKNKVENEIKEFSEKKRREFNELFHKVQREKDYIFNRIYQIDENIITDKSDTSTRLSTNLSSSIQSSSRTESIKSIKSEDDLVKNIEKEDEYVKKEYYNSEDEEEEDHSNDSNDSEEEEDHQEEEEKEKSINILSSSIPVNIPLKMMPKKTNTNLEEPQFSYIQKYHLFRNKYN